MQLFLVSAIFLFHSFQNKQWVCGSSAWHKTKSYREDQNDLTRFGGLIKAKHNKSNFIFFECTYNATLCYLHQNEFIYLKNFIVIYFQNILMNWTGEHCAFNVKTFFKSNESVIAIQRAFHLHFKFKRRDPLRTHNTILLWVTNFRARRSTLKKKSPGYPSCART